MRYEPATLQIRLNDAITQLNDSRAEASRVIDMFHDRQYTAAEIQELNNSGRPVESFNVIKLFSTALLGYFDTVANLISISPATVDSNEAAVVMNDTVDSVLREQNYKIKKDYMLLDLFLTGYSVAYTRVDKTDKQDVIGRVINKVSIEHIPSLEVIYDITSTRDDWGDARYQHRIFWITKEEAKENWPKHAKVFDSYPQTVADNYTGNPILDNRATNIEMVQLIHSITKVDGRWYEQLWLGDTELEWVDITDRLVKFPYAVTRLYKSDIYEHYGVFREVYESQRAINQAILKIQLMVNTEKVLVQSGAVDSVEEFQSLYERVNSVIPVNSIKGIEVINFTSDVIQQYTIIDKALERIKSVLGVNDSFLGQSYASDSARKVSLQQQSSFKQLSWLVKRVELMQAGVGKNIVGLVKQYYAAHEVIKVIDPINGIRWFEVNKPIINEDGRLETVEEEKEKGSTTRHLTVVNEYDTDLAFIDAEVIVESYDFRDSRDRNQLMFETVMQGSVGQAWLQTDPGNYFAAASLQLREYGSKDSLTVSALLMQTAQKISQGQINPLLAMTGGNLQQILSAEQGGSVNNPNGQPAMPEPASPRSQEQQIQTKFNEGEQQ